MEALTEKLVDREAYIDELENLLADMGVDVEVSAIQIRLVG